MNVHLSHCCGVNLLPASCQIRPRHEPSDDQPIKRVSEYISNLLDGFGSKVQERMRRSRFYGWRMGLLIGSCMKAFVLCCNITLVIVALLRNKKKTHTVLNLVAGSTAATSQWSTIFHVLVNVLNTILLGASSYTVQVLSSPTRPDIDVAHAKDGWLDVGILGLRNLRFLPRGRVALRLLLGLSSIPLLLL